MSFVTKSVYKEIAFDIDKVPILIDNSKTTYIWWKKSFINILTYEENKGLLIMTVGPKGKVKGLEDFYLSWYDNEGKKYTHILTKVYYIPNLLFNLISIIEFEK